MNYNPSVFTKELTDYLCEFGQRYDAQEILDIIDSWMEVRVLVLGESIIDEYYYCESLGKSGKEPILAARYLRSDRFCGGALALANHLASFCSNTKLVTFIGDYDSHEDFILARLHDNIQPTFLRMLDTPTIIKRRFVESYPFQKLFEIYIMDECSDSNAMSRDLCNELERLLPCYDVVIVADYGHGMFNQEAIDLLSAKARFLAVNTQINAGNYGFNTISKYPRADFISLSEKEIRMDVRSRARDLKLIMEDVSDRMSCERMLITQGVQGCLCFQQGQGFNKVPAFSTHFIDRVGAGDAVFALTSLCAFLNIPMDIIGFIGNVIGSMAVLTVSNSQAIEPDSLRNYIAYLLQ